MRHATVLALNEIYEWIPSADAHSAWLNRACDWEPSYTGMNNDFINGDAQRLIRGDFVTLPDCPACAALLDLALEMRGGL